VATSASNLSAMPTAGWAGPPGPALAAAGEALGTRPDQAILGRFRADDPVGPDDPGGADRRAARPEDPRGPSHRQDARQAEGSRGGAGGQVRGPPRRARPHAAEPDRRPTAQIDAISARVSELIAQIPVAQGVDGDGTTGPAAGRGPDAAVLPTVARLNEITGCGIIAAQAIIAEIGLVMTVFGTPGRLVSWAKAARRPASPARRARPTARARATPGSTASSARWPPASRPRTREAQGHGRHRQLNPHDHLPPARQSHRPVQRSRIRLLRQPHQPRAQDPNSRFLTAHRMRSAGERLLLTTARLRRGKTVDCARTARHRYSGDMAKHALYAGIAWTEDGFEVAVVDEHRVASAPRHRFPAGGIRALLSYIRTLAQTPETSVICITDSTNGLIDGVLMAAGVDIYRLDPRSLPRRPTFGSVEADVLAIAAATCPNDPTRLVPREGTLTGRIPELKQCIRDGEDEAASLREAGRWITGAAGSQRQVALTFDDGPHPPFTARVLDTLAQHQVSATFFCVGMYARAYPDQVSRIAADGHEIGNHTWSHAFMPDLTRSEISEQIARTNDTIEAAAGIQCVTLFRPPFGSYSSETFAWLKAEGSGTRVVLWNVETADWARPGKDIIKARVLNGVQPGSIVLMHDGGGDRSQTVAALPGIIEGLQNKGYQFACVSELTRKG
jgi:peptidoglycan-N-acetylglucosamine deacetylase